MPLLPAFLTRLIDKSCESACQAARFPRVNEHTPAHRRSAWATRGLASHTELPKSLHTIPTYIVYDNVTQCFGHELLSGAMSFRRTERLAPLVAHGRARHFPAPGKREWPPSPYGRQSLTCLEYFARRLIRSVRPDRVRFVHNHRWCQFRRVFANLTVNGCPHGQFGGCHLFHPQSESNARRDLMALECALGLSGENSKSV